MSKPLYIPYQIDERYKLTLASIITGQNGVKDNIKVAWDEWNMFGWNFSTVNQDETYNLHDAIITALILNWLVRNCDTVKWPCIPPLSISPVPFTSPGKAASSAPPSIVFDLLSNPYGFSACADGRGLRQQHYCS